jgi:hypothetical protein
MTTRSPSPLGDRRRKAKSAAIVRPSPPQRRDELRRELLAIVELLQRCRADLVPEDFIADYVALDWLEWNGGALRITLTGKNICKQMQAGIA